MNLDAITQYILAIVPAVSALVGMAVVIGVGIGKIKRALSVSEEKSTELSRKQQKQIDAIIEQNRILRTENKELRRSLIELNKKIDIIDTIKATAKKG